MQHYFDSALWSEFMHSIIRWLFYDLPALAAIVVLMFILIKVNRVFFRRINRILIQRARNSQDDNVIESEKRINTLTGILKGVGRIALYTIFSMIILRRLGIDIAPLLAGAGILGLAIGFGAQELVRDFISGFFILLENQIRTGDVARINGTAGTIEKIELRTITMRDFDGAVHIFQNGSINTLANLTKGWSALTFEIGVAYKENTDQVMEVMRMIGKELYEDKEYTDHFLEPLTVLGLDRFDDSAVIIKARIKTIPGSQWMLGREYRNRLKKAFDKYGIEIPFPHTSIYWGEDIKPLSIQTEQKN